MGVRYKYSKYSKQRLEVRPGLVDDRPPGYFSRHCWGEHFIGLAAVPCVWAGGSGLGMLLLREMKEPAQDLRTAQAGCIISMTRDLAEASGNQQYLLSTCALCTVAIWDLHINPSDDINPSVIILPWGV